ncbi:chalcone isomerase family protein (plasmid) [Pseudoalteromonas xiamenensis]|uniref:chalcone isomerase family protein n=1 Tax=Pseudoalteromonas xiamenensis TaxID=882626 RepID=UPI0027E4AF9E|nr:chalcone isomerase family protein [Pseudoalteromonas xiamenensis]WMN62004.1 chalcone isomerase family protein [Pseudoalteromonas xiamenensis]
MRWFISLFIVFFICVVHSAKAQSAENELFKPVADEATYRYLFWDVYSAQLFTPTGQYNPEDPFTLLLKYKMTLKGKDIAERSIKEMKLQGLKDKSKQEVWGNALKSIFPDVGDGDVLLGQKNADGSTSFYYNHNQIGVIEDADFTSWFFNIWLGAKTSEPALRAELLGLGGRNK